MIVFPTNPTVNELYRDGNRVWRYDGEKWLYEPTPAPAAPYNPEAIYPPGTIALVQFDHQRDGWTTLYENTSGGYVGPETFDPAKWTRVLSGYEFPFGLDFINTGILSGGTIAKTGPTQVTVAPGAGVVLDKTNPHRPITQYVEWPAPVVVDLPGIVTDLVYALWMTVQGTVIATAGIPNPGQYRSDIYLGSVSLDPNLPTEIGSVVDWPDSSQTASDTVVDINHYFVPPQFIAGGALSAFGGNLKLNLDEGQAYAYNSNWHTDKSNPHVRHIPAFSPVTFDTIDQQHTVHLISQTDVPVNQWDNNSGALQAIPVDQAGITLLYYSVILDKTYSLYPQVLYGSLTEAINQLSNYAITAQIPIGLKVGTVYLGAVIAISQTTDLANPDEALVKSSQGSALAGGGQTVEELEGLNDVTLANPRNQEGLVYDGNSAMWRNQPLNELSGWVTQAAHGFTVGQAIRFAGAWTLADGDSDLTLAQALVGEVLDPDNFRYVLQGMLNWPAHGLTVGSQYYLSNTSGALDTVPGNFSQEILVPLDASSVLINIREDTSTQTVVGQAKYRFRTETDATDPTFGRIKINNAVAGSATEVYINDTDDDGIDRAILIQSMRIDDAIVLSSQISDNRYIYVVRGPVVDNGGWYTIPVSVAGIRGTLAQNERIVFSTVYRASGSDAIRHSITQVAHGFTVGQAVSFNGTAYVLAQADSETTLAWGLVARVLGADSFEYCQYGRLDWPAHGFAINTDLFLSPAAAGGLTATKPTTAGQFVQMLAIAVDADTVRVFDYVTTEA